MKGVPVGIPGAHEADRFCPLPGGMQLCYRTAGPDHAEPVVLIAGLGLQLTSWPKTMTRALTEHGYRLIMPDNRDVGRSSRAPHPAPALWRQALRKPRALAYDLDDMAADVVALLDHLNIDSAHVVGMSMGGMIAQQIAVHHGHRVRSLTSIFSTTGARDVGQPRLASLLRLMAPPPRTRAQAVQRYLSMLGFLAGKGFPVNEPDAQTYAHDAWDRGGGVGAHEGPQRQIEAIFKSGDRTFQLREISVPALVIHGDADPLVHPSGGMATAAAIPEAKHVSIAGMGHYLADGAVLRIVGLIDKLARSAAVRPPLSRPSSVFNP